MYLQRQNRYFIPGKRILQPLAKTVVAGKTKIVYSTSGSTDVLFLVDTGAKISAIPHKSGQQIIPTSYKLQTANESKIDTYSEKPLNLDSGLCRVFS